MAGQMILFTAGSLGRLVRRTINRSLKSLGLSSVQISALVFISENGGVNQKDIEDELNLTRATVSAMTDGLEECGFVTREKDPADARVRRIVITDKGRAILEKARELTEETEKILSSSISEEEKSMYFVITQKLKEVMEESLC